MLFGEDQSEVTDFFHFGISAAAETEPASQAAAQTRAPAEFALLSAAIDALDDQASGEDGSASGPAVTSDPALMPTEWQALHDGLADAKPASHEDGGQMVASPAAPEASGDDMSFIDMYRDFTPHNDDGGLPIVLAPEPAPEAGGSYFLQVMWNEIIVEDGKYVQCFYSSSSPDSCYERVIIGNVVDGETPTPMDGWGTEPASIVDEGDAGGITPTVEPRIAICPVIGWDGTPYLPGIGAELMLG